MAELEPSWYVGLPDEIARQKLVYPSPHLFLGALRHRGREIELERIADDRCRLGQRERGRGEQLQLRRDGTCDRRRDASPVRRLWLRVSSTGASELERVERIAPALMVETLDVDLGDAADELPDTLELQRAELDGLDAGSSLDAADRLHDGEIALPGPDRHRDQDRGLRRATREVREQLERGAVGPLQVIQDQHDRAGGGEPFDQLPDGMVDAEALRRRDRILERFVEIPERGEHDRKRAEPVLGQAIERAAVERLEIRVERVDEKPERELLLELRRPPVQSHATESGRGVRQLLQQPRLPDPRFARDDNEAGVTTAHALEHCLQHREFSLPTEKGLPCPRHG